MSFGNSNQSEGSCIEADSPRNLLTPKSAQGSEELLDFCEDTLTQVKQFIYILYGSCVRFYSTVIDWNYLQKMKEDIIERLTSNLFNEGSFAELVQGLCRELTRRDEEALDYRLS